MVQYVLRAARQVETADLGGRPQYIGEEQHPKSEPEEQRNTPGAGFGRARQEEHAEYEQQQTIEPGVDLTQHLLEKIGNGPRRGRANHQEPKKRAEAHHTNRRIDRQLSPGYAYGGGPDQVQCRNENGGIERDAEDIGWPREGIMVEQPAAGGDHAADEIKSERDRQPDPSGPQRSSWGTA